MAGWESCGGTFSVDSKPFQIIGVCADLQPENPLYPPANQTQFYRQLLQRVERMPRVKAAGIEQPGSTVFFQPEGQAATIPGQEPTAGFNVVSPGDFTAMGNGMVARRGVTQNEAEGANPVALISEMSAQHDWPNSNPIGSHFSVMARVYLGKSTGTAKSLEIVGIVKNRRGYNLWEPRSDISRAKPAR